MALAWSELLTAIARLRFDINAVDNGLNPAR